MAGGSKKSSAEFREALKRSGVDQSFWTEVEPIYEATSFEIIKIVDFLKLREELERFDSVIKSIDIVTHQQEFLAKVRELLQFLAAEPDPDILYMLKTSKHFEHLRARLQPHCLLYFRFMENEASARVSPTQLREILTQPDSSQDFLDDDLYKRFSAKKTDFEHLSHRNIKRLVLVGAGSFPETMFHLYHHTKIPHILGLDYEYGCTSAACRILGSVQSGMTNPRMRFAQANGLEYDYTGADHVHIAGYVPSKADIIRRVIETAGQRISITAVDFSNSYACLILDGLDPKELEPDVQVKRTCEVVTPYLRKQVHYLSANRLSY